MRGALFVGGEVSLAARTAQRAIRPLCLQVQELVVEHVAVVDVLIGPVAGLWNVEQAARVVLPRAEQEAHALDGRPDTLDKRVVASRTPVFAAADHEPQVGVHPAGGPAVADVARVRIDVAGNLAVRPLMGLQRQQRIANGLCEFFVARHQRREADDDAVAPPDAPIVGDVGG